MTEKAIEKREIAKITKKRKEKIDKKII